MFLGIFFTKKRQNHSNADVEGHIRYGINNKVGQMKRNESKQQLRNTNSPAKKEGQIFHATKVNNLETEMSSENQSKQTTSKKKTNILLEEKSKIF